MPTVASSEYRAAREIFTLVRSFLNDAKANDDVHIELRNFSKEHKVKRRLSIIAVGTLLILSIAVLSLRLHGQGSNFGAPLLVSSGTSTMASGAVGMAACATAVTTAATGALTTDSIEWAYAAAPSITTDALLTIAPYVTSGNVNFTRCNPTAASITGTAIVINWRVIR